MLRSLKHQAERKAPTVAWVVEHYRIEKMPGLRHSTQRVTELWVKKYVLASWGPKPITDLQPRPVQLWLESLPLAPKTRGHLRELLYRLVDYAMWCGSIPVGTNPVSLVTVRGSSKRQTKPRSLTVAEFHILAKHLREPFKTMVLLQLCLGLRVSELLALRWQDVDWMGSTLNVEHGIVNQHLDSVKTEGSRKTMTLDARLLPDPSRVETNHGVSGSRGLVISFAGQAGPLAIFLHGILAGPGYGNAARGTRAHGHARIQAQLPLMA